MFPKLIFKALACISIIILLCNGKTEHMARIIGGHRVEIKDWYFIVSMFAQPRNYTPSVNEPRFWFKKKCSGVIVNEGNILTAAHCLHERKPEDVVFAAGGTRIERALKIDDKNELLTLFHKDGKYGKTHRFVKSTVIHPRFNRDTLENDIAIAKITTPFTFKHQIIGPIPLETLNQIPKGRKYLKLHKLPNF